MQQPQTEPDDIAEQAMEVTRAIKQAINQNLPPEMRAARNEFLRRRREINRARWKDKEARKAAFNKSIHERMLDGHNQIEVVRAIGSNEKRVADALSGFWSLPKPGRDYRYIAIAVSPADLAVLDDLCRDMLLTRRRTLEAVAKAFLESGAAVARRTLQVKRREHE